MKKKILETFIHLFPYFLIIAIISGLLLAFLIGRPDFAIRGLIIAIPSIFSAIFLSLIYKENIFLDNSTSTFSFNQRSMGLLIGILYFISIIILAITYERSQYYFIVMLVIYILIFAQILSQNSRPNLILIEIALCLLNFIYGITLKYPLYFGGSDILAHSFLSNVTYLSGHIVPPDLSLYYTYFPLYHIYIAEASYLLGLNIKISLFIVTALIYSTTVIFIYYLFNRVIDNQQISLLTCLLYSTSATVLNQGSYMVTRTLAFVGFIILIYLIYMDKHKTTSRILIILMSGFLILVHQVSIIQILVLMSILALCEWIASSKKYFTSGFFILVITMFTGYWFETAYVFTQNILITHLQAKFLDHPRIESNIVTGNEWIFISNHIDVFIFLFFALIGIGYILQKEKNNYTFVFGLFSLGTLIFYIPSPLQTLWQTMSLFRFDRLMLIVSPFMAFSMGYGMYVFYSYLIHKKVKKYNILLIIFFLFSTFILTSLYNVQVSNNLQSESQRRYFTDNELNGFDHISKSVPYGSTLYSDYYTSRYFIQTKCSISEVFNLPYYDSKIISDTVDIPHYKGYLIIRDKQFSECGLPFGSLSSTYSFTNTDLNSLDLKKKLQNFDLIYSSSFMSLYHRK